MTNSRVRLVLLLTCVAVCVAWSPAIAGEHPWDADGGDRMDDYINQPNDPGSAEADEGVPNPLNSVETGQLEASSPFGPMVDRMIGLSLEWFYRVRLANDRSSEPTLDFSVAGNKDKLEKSRFGRR